MRMGWGVKGGTWRGGGKEGRGRMRAPGCAAATCRARRETLRRSWPTGRWPSGVVPAARTQRYRAGAGARFGRRLIRIPARSLVRVVLGIVLLATCSERCTAGPLCGPSGAARSAGSRGRSECSPAARSIMAMASGRLEPPLWRSRPRRRGNGTATHAAPGRHPGPGGRESVRHVTAVTVVSEITTFRRFPNPRQLMGYAGLVPREHSSGASSSSASCGPLATRSSARRSVWQADPLDLGPATERRIRCRTMRSGALSPNSRN